MSDMIRYSTVEAKNKREIVLLKGFPCIWGRCAFCDYTNDNSTLEAEMTAFNHEVLQNVTGQFGVLEVINSGSVFELPKETLSEIRSLVRLKGIQKLFFESYWGYRHRLQEIREYFGVPIMFKCGLETFDNTFRTEVLNKGFVIKGPEEVRHYFDSVCLMAGVQGQTKEMLQRDMEYLTSYFPHGCINIYVDNTTKIQADPKLIAWFKDNYGYLDKDPRYEVLWNNTDFGVGGDLA